jgi:EmrB/QacA subfamily drug resistance transporter
MNNQQFSLPKILASLMLCLFLAVLDSSIVGTALPKIVSDLGGLAYYSLPVSVYLLFSAVFVPVAGKLSDVFGRRRVFLSAVALFILASVLCGLSRSMIMFIACRAVQGASGGAIVSGTFIIVSQLTSPEERGKYIGILSTMFGLASVAGPFIGGCVTDALSWHWIFFVNIPVGLAAFALVSSFLPALKPDRSSKLDIAGILLFLAAFVPMLALFAETGKHIRFGSSAMTGLAVFSAVMLMLFIAAEKRSDSPMLPAGLLKNRLFAFSALSAFFAYAAMYGVILYAPYQMQIVLHKSASFSGFIMVPMSAAMLAGGMTGGALVSKSMKYRSLGITGFALAAAALAFLLFTGSAVSVKAFIAVIAAAGFGIALTFAVYNVAPQAAYPQSFLGILLSTIEFSQVTGGVVSASLSGSMIGRNPSLLIAMSIAFLLLGALSMSMLNDGKIAEGLEKHFRRETAHGGESA